MTIGENLDVFLSDFGVTVTLGGTDYVGVLDMPDELVGDGMAISTEYKVLVKRADVPEASATRGTAITVDGVAYKVREYRRIDDGKFAKLTLTKT